MRKAETSAARFCAGLALLLLVLAVGGCAKPASPAPERPPAPVSVVAAIAEDVPAYLDEIGKCAAKEKVSIQAQVSGRIEQILFADGADLKTGDPLFTIDPRHYQAQLQAAEANLAQAKAVLQLAQSEFARVEKLVDTKAISRQDYDARKNATDVAEADVQRATAAVQTARLNLDYCEIRSPIDGRAGQRLVDPGNVINAGTNTSLLVIQKLDPIYADFTVAENDLTAVQRNMRAGSLKVQVSLPEEPGDVREGELTFLDNAVQESTGTVKLRATLQNPDHHFWPGRFVRVRLVLNTHKGAVLVPATAMQLSAKGPFVYVVKEDSTAELRLVTPGQRQGDFIVMNEGLAVGERVVVTGQMAVTPGGKVRIEETGTAHDVPATKTGAGS